MLPRVAGLSGRPSKCLHCCFVSRKNVILKDILCIFRKLWFCSTSNIPIFLAKTWSFRKLEMTLMYARGASAGNPETWALKNTCRCLKKTATPRKINWNISFFRIFHMDLNCFCTVSILRDANLHCATQHIKNMEFVLNRRVLWRVGTEMECISSIPVMFLLLADSLLSEKMEAEAARLGEYWRFISSIEAWLLLVSIISLWKK